MLWKELNSWTKGFSLWLDWKRVMKDTAETIKLPGQHCSNYSDNSDLAIDIDITSELSHTATYSSHVTIARQDQEELLL
jgi:hypothetical protein